MAKGPPHDLMSADFQGQLVAPTKFFSQVKRLSNLRNYTVAIGWTDQNALYSPDRYFNDIVVNDMIEAVRSNYLLINELNRPITFVIRIVYAKDDLSIQNLKRMCEVLEPLIGEFSFTVLMNPNDINRMDIDDVVYLLSQLCTKTVISEVPDSIVDEMKKLVEIGNKYGSFGNTTKHCPVRNTASFVRKIDFINLFGFYLQLKLIILKLN